MLRKTCLFFNIKETILYSLLFYTVAVIHCYGFTNGPTIKIRETPQNSVILVLKKKVVETIDLFSLS